MTNDDANTATAATASTAATNAVKKPLIPNVPTLLKEKEHEALVLAMIQLIEKHEIIAGVRKGKEKGANRDFVTRIAPTFKSYDPNAQRAPRSFEGFVRKLLKAAVEAHDTKLANNEHPSIAETTAPQILQNLEDAKAAFDLEKDENDKKKKAKRLKKQMDTDAQLARNLQNEERMGLPNEPNNKLLQDLYKNVDLVSPAPAAAAAVPPAAMMAKVTPTPVPTHQHFLTGFQGSAAAMPNLKSTGLPESPPASAITQKITNWDMSSAFGPRGRDAVDDLDKHSLYMQQHANTVNSQVYGLMDLAREQQRLSSVQQRTNSRRELMQQLAQVKLDIAMASPGSKTALIDLKQQILEDLASLSSGNNNTST